MIKQFLVQVVPGQETRYLCDDVELAKIFTAMLESAVETWTSGPKPGVLVSALSATQALIKLNGTSDAKLRELIKAWRLRASELRALVPWNADAQLEARCYSGLTDQLEKLMGL